MLAIVAGSIGAKYKRFAERYGWPIGKLFYYHDGWVKVLSIIAIIGGVIESFSLLKFWMGSLSIGLSFLLGWLLIVLFKERVQWIAIICLIASIVVWCAFGFEIMKIDEMNK